MNTERNSKVLDCLCYLFLFFLFGCLTGWIYEEIFYWITEGMLRNRGILYGPWLPIYGIGALGIYALKPIKKHPLILFLLCNLITGIVEYVIGYCAIRIWNLRLWDYRGLFLNIDGIVCLRSVLSFAIMGMAFHYLVEPVMERFVASRRSHTVHMVCMIILVLFVIDCIISALFRTPITY